MVTGMSDQAAGMPMQQTILQASQANNARPGSGSGPVQHSQVDTSTYLQSAQMQVDP